MKVGDLVKYGPTVDCYQEWADWIGVIIGEIPGTDERKIIMWNKDNNIRTSNPKRDLRLAYESR